MNNYEYHDKKSVPYISIIICLGAYTIVSEDASEIR